MHPESEILKEKKSGSRKSGRKKNENNDQAKQSRLQKKGATGRRRDEDILGSVV